MFQMPFGKRIMIQELEGQCERDRDGEIQAERACGRAVDGKKDARWGVALTSGICL